MSGNLSVTRAEWEALVSMIETCPDFLSYENAQNKYQILPKQKLLSMKRDLRVTNDRFNRRIFY